MGTLIRDVVAWDCREVAAKRADLVLEEGRITAILPPGEGEGELLLDGKGQTALLPGFVNAHTHAAMSLLRGLGEELPLMDWLEKRIWPVENNLKAEHVRAGTMSAILEMLATGTTAFADMYFFMDQVADGVEESGIRANLARGLIGDDPCKLKDGLALADRFPSDHRQVRVDLGPHAPYTVPAEVLSRIGALAVDRGLGVHSHWLETQWESGYFAEELKCDPVDLLERSGFFEAPQLVLAHGVWFRPEHLPRLARQNVTVVHNPCSNLKLGSGLAPVAEMLAQGVRVALGTDGAASNNRLDIWGEIRAAALVHKGWKQDPTLVTAQQVLAMATRNGSLALGFDRCGLLEPGFEADFVAVDLRRPHYVGWDEENLAGYLVYAGSSADVCATLVGGRVLYQGGSYPNLDAPRILESARKVRQELIEGK